ncbi:MAG: ATP-binding cassette domain-containing protein [Gammaproteobacteria bacterium]|nr:ATP-binding cassette domain-containing protein [Gammaproteobacteria bacterium]
MIRTQALTKRYGPLVAVDDLSFEVAAGTVLGFLGPNGAGKSTTMKMLAGFISPTSGQAIVGGHDVVAAPLAVKRLIGYLPEGAPSYGEMTVRQFMRFIAEIRGLAGDAGRRRLDEVSERLGLTGVQHQSIETLSKGFRRRVGLAQAIVHDPAVLILDEPTDGLDPNQKHEVRSLIRDMASDKIIIISTHILEEVDALCSRAIIIGNGRLLADDEPRRLEARSRYHNAVSLRLAERSLQAAACEALRGLPQVASVEQAEDRVTALPKAGEHILPAVAELAREQGWPLSELHLESGRLDEVFRSITTQAAP